MELKFHKISRILLTMSKEEFFVKVEHDVATIVQQGKFCYKFINFTE